MYLNGSAMKILSGKEKLSPMDHLVGLRPRRPTPETTDDRQ